MTSPASTGPAGSHFEGRVAAHYLLSMLVGASPRGLPGTTIDRVELQRAQEGMYLDDVIVRAHDRSGLPAVLEIQVKRTITFAPTDEVFRLVVQQIARTSTKTEFWSSKYELAVGTARTSRKIDGAYQDVLTWARQLGDAKTFTERIERHGSANEDMRTFVRTFASHLRDAGAAHDHESVWRLLRRFQILIFDYTAQGSASEELAKERAVRALEPEDVLHAGELWGNLTDLALEIAAAGGDRDRGSLLNDLSKWSFRLAALPLHSKSEIALAEASRHALWDIEDRVCGVLLTRQDYIASVHAALETSRYVEIRGDAGVGKSGVLRHFAEQILTESQILLLTPGRTPPGGWLQLRNALSYEGSCRDLLHDLARNGGGVLFIDNLDFFSYEERTTVLDIVREAVTVPGIFLIATARREFGRVEPSWIPKAVTESMGVELVLVKELSDNEIEQLRAGAPQIAWLLADNHPARSVTRNLFRLSRLASLHPGETIPLSEAEMALRWWSVADGVKDEGYLDRFRLLRSLADQIIARSERLNTLSSSSAAVYALIQSETLRDLGDDYVAFRHDVLREWSVANLIHSDRTVLDRLPLKHAAPIDLGRAVELSARMIIESAPDAKGWLALLKGLTGNEIHPSWRRAVLLALVRSELATALLPRAANVLFENKAQLLRELIRTVTAVDSEPASKRFRSLGFDPEKIPSGINVPSGPSWLRLILWLMGIGRELPPAAIPDVVKLYSDWSMGMMGVDPVTPMLLQQLYEWLMEIEMPTGPRSSLFKGELDWKQVDSLASEIRTSFLLFCSRTPELASQYLKSFASREHAQEAMLAILKFRGTLAQAAPADLVDFTIAALIPESEVRGPRNRSRPFERVFDYADLKFIPASPAQGPFLELLNHAPAHGLRLIRQLVDHAVSFYSGGRDYGEDFVGIPFNDGPRVFPWTRSYVWSRRDGDAPYLVTSALMALEIWAHRRIEAGDSIEAVLADVLDQSLAPTAYLLVAVDLLISHWPKSKDAAISFLASPELMCLDRNRLAFDTHEEFPDFFGLKALQKEPPGAASIEDLDKLPSRSHVLDELLDNYLDQNLSNEGDSLVKRLQQAAARLSPPTEASTLLDPEFMVRYALNRLNPANWQPRTVELRDGSTTKVPTYFSPPDEADQFERLQKESQGRRVDAQMAKLMGNALERPGAFPQQYMAVAIAWAQEKSQKAGEADGNETDKNWIREQTVLAVALVVARDGISELRNQHRSWLREVFAYGLKSKDDTVHRVRGGLKFNPIAIAFLGLIHLLKDHRSAEDIRELLEVAARDNPAAAHGMAAGAYDLAVLDERLPRAVLRTALLSRNQPLRDWDEDEEKFGAQTATHRQRVQSHIDAEIGWLENHGPEPPWPDFIRERPHLSYQSRRHAADSQSEPSVSDEPKAAMRTDDQGAGLWLESLVDIFDVAARPWLRDIINMYGQWTKIANGSGFDLDERIDGEPEKWNEAYFKLLPACLVDLSVEEVGQIVSDHFSSLPEEAFFDAITLFQRNVDFVYFSGTALSEGSAVKVRSVLAERMMSTNGWKRLQSVREDATEIHIARAVATMFFADYGYLQAPRSYLREKGIDRLLPFLPTLQTLVTGNPSPFVANVSLTLLEVSPRPDQLPFLVSCGLTWMPEYPDDTRFWVDYGFGNRWCALVEAILKLDPKAITADSKRKADVDHLLAALVKVGVSEASRLEEALRTLSER